MASNKPPIAVGSLVSCVANSGSATSSTPSPRFEIVDAAASLTNPASDGVVSVADIVDARGKRRKVGRQDAEYDAVDGRAFAGLHCK